MKTEQARVLVEAVLGPDWNTRTEPPPLDLRDRATRDHRDLVIGLLLERDGGKCYLCRKELDSTVTVEHIIPIARGGTNSSSNVALACADCNYRKGQTFVSLSCTSGLPVYHLR